MIDSEQLVQRFVDQELSVEDRVRFVVQLGRDAELRQRLIDLEQLSLAASRLQRPVVPDGFVARVMEQTARSRPMSRRLLDAFWSPHVLHWNVASAVAVACLVSIAVGGVVAGGLSWRRQSEQVRGGGLVPVAAPSPVLVRLLVVHPGARTVQAAGDFNGWNPTRTPLEQVSNGAWVVTIPLEPGRYEYMYVVDGREWIADPFAAEQSDDGFGSRNAVLDVRQPTEASL